MALVDVEEQPAKRRRRLNFTFVEEFSVPLQEMDPVDELRSAVKRWQEHRRVHVGDFRNPSLSGGSWNVVGKCMRHTACHAGDGRYFRFRGVVRPHSYVLCVDSAGECGEDERIVRAAGSSSLGQPSVEDRAKIHEIADNLLGMGCAATPTAVQLALPPGKAPDC